MIIYHTEQNKWLSNHIEGVLVCQRASWGGNGCPGVNSMTQYNTASGRRKR